MINLISLSEKEQRLIIILFIILVAFLALFGLLGLLVQKVMAFQSRKVDAEMSYLVTSKVITNERHFRYIARKKNYRLVFAQFFFPLLIIGLDFLFIYLFIHFAHGDDWSLFKEMFNYDQRGVRTLFFVWDWKNVPHATFFGLSLPNDWPPLLNSPHFVIEAWPNYLFATLFLVSVIWLIVVTQAFIARSWRIYKKSRVIFITSLDNINIGGNLDNINRAN